MIASCVEAAQLASRPKRTRIQAVKRIVSRAKRRAKGAFPHARVLSLCETGSHVLWRSLIRPCCRSGSIPAA
jgi:hypothetical protein